MPATINSCTTAIVQRVCGPKPTERYAVSRDALHYYFRYQRLLALPVDNAAVDGHTPTMTTTIEYGEVKSRGLEPATVTVLATAPSNTSRRTIRLESVSSGWEPAGAAARIVSPYFAVRFDDRGVSHGQRFRTLDEAKALFARWTGVNTNNTNNHSSQR